MKKGEFEVINLGKEAYLKPDAYLNGWAKYCGWKATLVFDSLCRHADRNRESFPSIDLMAKEHGVSYNTIRRGVKDLEEWRIVVKKRKRNKKGKWIHNTYYILHKKHWKKPQPPQGDGSSIAPTGKNHSPHRAIKGTHNKGTHNNNLKVIAGTRKITPTREYGKPEINKIISYLKEKLSLPELDESEATNRRYGWNLFRKCGSLEKCLRLIDLAAADEWYRDNITSVRDLYYKRIKLVSRKRGGMNGAVDAREV